MESKRITLKALFKDLQVELKGSRDVAVTGLSSHSRSLTPGGLFIARKGRQTDGNAFIPEALRAGASAILTDFYNPFMRDVTQIIAPNPAALEPLLAERYYRFPTQKLFIVGVTGTDGKTTTAYLIQRLLSTQDKPCGMLGTVEYVTGRRRLMAGLTTPDIITSQRLFREMVDDGLSSAVMEVSSHALDQERTQTIDFNVAVLTNITRDHLDYHPTLSDYIAAKAKLFAAVDTPGKGAVINGDDPVYASFSQLKRARLLSYGMRKDVDLHGALLERDLEGMTMRLTFQGKVRKLRAPLIGAFNGYNLLAAVGVALIKGVPWTKIQERVASLPPIPGRLERIRSSAPFALFVDFAHTPEALRAVLQELRPLCQRQLTVLFGAGGDRDQGKRREMGQVAEAHADRVVVTSDNPRSEDPRGIIEAICAGLRFKDKALIEIDRKKAIEKALQRSGAGDIVLLAGRGHEPMQTWGKTSIPFDDRVVARDILSGMECKL